MAARRLRELGEKGVPLGEHSSSIRARAVIAELTGRGVELLNGPTDRPWGHADGAVADPDGHIREIAADIAS